MYSVGDKVVHPMHGAGTIEEIKENDYDLSINKYKEVIYEKIEYRPSKEILGDIASLNQEIDKFIKELQSLLED